MQMQVMSLNDGAFKSCCINCMFMREMHMNGTIKLLLQVKNSKFSNWGQGENTDPYYRIISLYILYRSVARIYCSKVNFFVSDKIQLMLILCSNLTNLALFSDNLSNVLQRYVQRHLVPMKVCTWHIYNALSTRKRARRTWLQSQSHSLVSPVPCFICSTLVFIWLCSHLRLAWFV